MSIGSLFFTNFMNKFIILKHLLHSSTCFNHHCAHIQENNCINTASGIVTVFRWLISPFVTCVLNSHLKTVTIPDAVLSGVPRGEVWGVRPPPPKFWRPPKIVPNPTRLWNLLKIAEFRKPTPQDVRKKGSKILKLPLVRNCCTLAMTNKLDVITNSLKVTKVKKILLYEMKFLLSNYSCLQNPWLGGYLAQIPVLSVLCPQLNFVNPPPREQNSWVRHWLY